MSETQLLKPDLTYTLPDTSVVMPQGVQEWVLTFFGGFTVLLVAYVAWMCWRKKTFLPMIFLLGAAWAIMLEPLADVMGNVIHAPVGQDFVFQAEGHPVPLHILLGYVWYYGLGNILMYNQFANRTVTPVTWWKATLVAFLGVTIIEQIPIFYKVWVYYGEHALFIGNMPLTMISGNFCSVVVLGLVTYKIFPMLTGWKQWIALPMVPMVVVGSHTGASIPSYIILGQNTATLPAWLLYAGTICTFVFALLMIWLTIGIVYNRFETTNSATAKTPGGAGASAIA